MLSSAAAAIGGLFVGTQSEGKGCRSLVAGRPVERRAGDRIARGGAFPVRGAVTLPRARAQHAAARRSVPSTVDLNLGASELLPALAILPFMLYQLAGFGTMHYVIPKLANWIINVAVLGLIIASYVANRMGDYAWERHSVGAL